MCGSLTGSDNSLVAENRYLSLISLNCKGFKANCDYVRSLVAVNDIVCLSETWLRPNDLNSLSIMTSSLANCDDFCVFSKSSMEDIDCIYSGRPFGGLAVITKVNPSVSFSEIKTDSDRLLVVGVYDNSGELVHTIFCVYLPFFQPGNADQLSLFVETLDELQVLIDEYGRLAPFKICGDMNAQLPRESVVTKNWYRKDGFNGNSVLLYDFLVGNDLCVADFKFKQDVQYTYFVHKNRTYTWIDHVISNSYDINSVISCKIFPESSDNSSDHLPIQMRFKVKVNRAPNSKGDVLRSSDQFPRLDWNNCTRRATYARILSDKLNATPLLQVDREDSWVTRQEKVDGYAKGLSAIMHESAREAGCNVSDPKRRKLYWSPQMRELKERKRFWWNIWIENCKPRRGIIYECYKNVKRQFRRASRQGIQKHMDERVKFLSSRFRIGQTKRFWNGIKMGRQVKTPSLLNVSDFTKFYSNIMQDDVKDLSGFQQEVKAHVTRVSESHCNRVFSVNVSPHYIAESLPKLRKGCAAGLDGITTEHLQYGQSDILYKHLSVFYSIIFSMCIVPHCFTVGTIIPILKKATLNPNLPANYRPITLTSTFAKLAELFLKPDDEVLGLSNSQYGFRECRGTEFCSAMLNDISLFCKEQRTPLYICSLDAEKCFDKIWHPGLFYKLLDKLSTDRWVFLYRWYGKLKSSVRWNGNTGEEFCVTRGTRQGSGLSPILFNIFINDLLLNIEKSGKGGIQIDRYFFNIFAYADDVTVFSTSVTGLQELIDMCDNYAKTWRFNFGIKKTKCLSIGANPFKVEPKWSLSGEEISNVDSIDILGVVFDKYCNGGAHANQRARVCSNTFYGLARCGLGHPGGLSADAKIELLRTVCMPTLLYGCGSIYLSQGCFRKLNSLQGLICKKAFGLGKRLHHTPLLEAMFIKAVNVCIRDQALNLAYRIAKVNCPARDLVMSRRLENTAGCLFNRLNGLGIGKRCQLL